MKSIWGRDLKDPGLVPNSFCLAQWRRGRRLPADPEHPPQIGEANPYGEWDKIKCRKAIKAYCCREKAPAFCPPLPDSILVEAFKDLETQEKTKTSYKKYNENMKNVGGSMHALLHSQVPIFSRKEE